MSIKQEANQLLHDTGLLKLLEKYGEPHVTGSYLIDLMTWRDLDITVVNNQPSPDILFALVHDVNTCVKPHRFDGVCRDGHYFFGCETQIIGESWNIDIRFRSMAEHTKALQYCDSIKQRIAVAPSLGKAIVEIKQALIRLNMYGLEKHPERHYHSREIYDAVLNDGILTAEDFISKNPVNE